MIDGLGIPLTPMVDESAMRTALTNMKKQIDQALGGTDALRAFSNSQKSFTRIAETEAKSRIRVIEFEQKNRIKSDEQALRRIKENQIKHNQALELEDKKLKSKLELEHQKHLQRLEAQEKRADRARMSGGKESDGRSYKSWRDRNIVGGLGVLKAGAITSMVSTGLGALDTLFQHAKEADDAIDGIDISLSKVGITNKGLRDDMIKDGSVIANEFAKRTTDVNKLQAVVTGYGGQIGATNKRIVELALANEHALGVPAENLAKMFAKASDPENEAQLSRLGLVFKKGASDAERWALINERFGKSVDTAKKSTQDGVGNMQRAMNNFNDTIAKLANSLINVLGPAITGIGQMILALLSPIEMVIGGLDDLFSKSEEQKKREAQAKKTRADEFGKITTGQDLLAHIKRYPSLSPEMTRILTKGGVTSDMLTMAQSDATFGEFEKRAGPLLDKIASNIQLSRSMNKANEEDAKNTFNMVEAAQKQLDALLATKNKMPKSVFEHEVARLIGIGAKLPTAPVAPKGETLEQRRKRLFDEAKQALERQKKELIISEYKYYEELIDAAKRYYQRKEQLDAESELRILNKREQIQGRFPQQLRIFTPRAAGLQGPSLGFGKSPGSARAFLEEVGAPEGAKDFNTGELPFWRGGRGFLSDDERKQRGVDDKSMDRAQERFSEWQNVLGPVNDAFSSFFDNLHQGFMNSVIQPLIESKNAFQNFVGGFLSGLSSMVAALAAKFVLFSFLSLIGVATGTGGFWAGAKKFLFPGFAKGGTAPMGTPAFVGEQGPEMIVPTRRGTQVIPLSEKVKQSIRMGGLIVKRPPRDGQSIRQGGLIVGTRRPGFGDEFADPSIRQGGLIVATERPDAGGMFMYQAMNTFTSEVRSLRTAYMQQQFTYNSDEIYRSQGSHSNTMYSRSL